MNILKYLTLVLMLSALSATLQAESSHQPIASKQDSKVTHEDVRIKELQKAAKSGDIDAVSTLKKIDVEKLYRNLSNAARDGDAKVLARISKAADLGIPEAQTTLGSMYLRGLGVSKDEKKALELFTKGAEQDYIDAQFSLGVIYLNGVGVERDLKKVFRWIKKSAEKGDSQSQHIIGSMYKDGKGVEKNEKEALKWYIRSAKQGDAMGQYALGYTYLRGGEEVKKNTTLARKWFSKSAEQNNSHAQYELGVMYYEGNGGEKNEKAAFEWFSKSAELGNAEGQYNLGVTYFEGTSAIKVDLEKAKYWFEKAAEQGIEDAKLNLGVIASREESEDSININIDMSNPDEAAMLDEFSKNDDKEQLIKNYNNHIEKLTTKSKAGDAKALQRLEDIANHGIARAQANLGALYLDGQGVKKDKKLALKWLSKAAEQGDSAAKESLKALSDDDKS